MAAREPLRILVDVDGVLADFVGLVLDYVHRSTGLIYRREAVDQWDCFAALNLPDRWPWFRQHCDTTDACRAMREMPGARELWAAVIAIDPRAKVCTTPMTVAWLSQRAAWLEAFGIPLAQQWHGHEKEDLTRPGALVGFLCTLPEPHEPGALSERVYRGSGRTPMAGYVPRGRA